MRGTICVTGGTGFLGSWIVKRLLEDGYSVNTTTRVDPADISYLTNLPGASERLQIYNADLNSPDESFAAAIEGCIGVFHTAHPLYFDQDGSEEIKRLITGTQAILKACADSKTVKRVVYTSSITAAIFNFSDHIDESSWTDSDNAKTIFPLGATYAISKVLVEKTAFEYADKYGLDLVTVLPTWITGPYICPSVPDSVRISLALILGNEAVYPILKSTTLVHVDDVARAHIHLFEHENAKGRYLCTGVEVSIEDLCELISLRYPEYEIPSAESLKDLKAGKSWSIPSKKLLESGFKYENGLNKMFDEAILCCKLQGFL